MLLGTAGHVDHGKTTLVRALTGVDCDRLEAEKTRGITIELGFAAWDLPDGRRVDVVDVPGHERLVRTMLVGAAGMDAVLLAVAADSGVMPQTREHLAACAALGVRRGVVALTRADLCPDIDAARAAVRSALAGTVLAEAPIVPVCAPTGAGLDALSAAVAALLDAWRPPPADAPLYLPIDRVFTISGAGTVVTGSLVRGSIQPGDSVAVVPGLERARVRGLQSHGVALPLATAGHRVAVNLAVPRAAIRRGAVLCAPGTVAEGRVFDAVVRLADHLTRPVHRLRGVTVHLGATRVLGDLRADAPIAPGGEGTARLRVLSPTPLPPGGRFVLRGAADHVHGAVVGGGRILDAMPPRRRSAAVRAGLWRGDARAVLIEEAGRRGVEPTDLARRIPVAPETGPRRFAPAVVQEAATELAARIDAWHAAHPESVGFAPDARLAPALLDAARAALGDAIEASDGRLRRPGHVARLSDADHALSRKLMRAIGRAGLDGLDLATLTARFVQVAQPQLERVLRHLERVGRVARVGEAWVGGREARAVRRMAAIAVLEGPVDVAAFKQLSGTTRRRAIPLLEWLDGLGVTRREGNLRVAGPAAAEYANEAP